jgi:hypothetical protein
MASLSTNGSFKATGAASAAFFTDGDHITFGVNVQGVDVRSKEGAGVYAESMLQSPGTRKSPANSRSGVWAVGDHYGVYGASDLLYGVGGSNRSPPLPSGDNTPVLSQDQASNTPPDNAKAKGGIGVVGASLNVPGVIGTSDITNTNFPNKGAGSFLNGITDNTAGVMGLSATSTGVMGVNIRGASANQPPSVQILSFLVPNQMQSNAGVFGWSLQGRGGVFASAQPMGALPAIANPTPDVGQAQLRLLPNLATHVDMNTQQPEVGLIPRLPGNGLPGDLITVKVQGGSGHAALYFCVGVDANDKALWGQVQFTQMIPGVR